MKENRPRKIFSAQMGAIVMAQAIRQFGINTAALREFSSSIVIRRHRVKHRNSGAGSKNYWISGNTNRQHPHIRENSRRLRQIEAGMLRMFK